MQAQGYTHAFQSTTFSMKEFQQGSVQMQTYLQSLANELNSGEKFNTNSNFETELTLICTPPAGSGIVTSSEQIVIKITKSHRQRQENQV